jgi:hypothetical protein
MGTAIDPIISSGVLPDRFTSLTTPVLLTLVCTAEPLLAAALTASV